MTFLEEGCGCVLIALAGMLVCFGFAVVILAITWANHVSN